MFTGWEIYMIEVVVLLGLKNLVESVELQGFLLRNMGN